VDIPFRLAVFFVVSALLGTSLTIYFVPNIGDLLVMVAGVALVLMAYFWKNDLPELWSISSVVVGAYGGLFLNITLSTGFLSSPNFVYLAVGLFATSCLLWATFKTRQGVGWHEKLPLVFMGFWISSLALSLTGFATALNQWLSLLPQQSQINVEASAIINVLKSLFLASLFNMLERITRRLKQ